MYEEYYNCTDERSDGYKIWGELQINIKKQINIKVLRIWVGDYGSY